MKQVGNTILAKGGNHILAKRDNSAWPKGSKLSGFSMYMEIVSIEKKTFEEMVAQTDAFVEKVAALQLKGDAKRLGKWLTGEEVCGQLRISQRTLQKLRDRGFIGYSQIGFRFYYKPEDVKRLIPLIGTICPTDR